MTAPPRADRRVLEIDPLWCWSRLRSTREGILSFSSAGRPRTLPVAYAVHGQRVIIAMVPMNAAGWRADGSKVSLEITGPDAEDGRWFVSASGHVHRELSSVADAALLASPLERPRLASDPQSHQLTMPLAYVRGCYEQGPRSGTSAPAAGTPG